MALESGGKVKASVIVPTLDRSVLLRATIASIARQTLPADQFEIIVVDNGSTDNTVQTVDSLIKGHPDHRIRYIYEPEPGLLAGRHRGASEAVEELLVFVDDDIEAVPGWLAAIVSAFEDPQVQLAGGRNLPKYETDAPPWIESFWDAASGGGRYCYYLSLLDLGEEKRQIIPNYVFGLNFAIRRQALFDLGGFHPDSYSDELQRFVGDGETGLTTIAEARGFVAVYEPAATVYHFTPSSRMTVEYFVDRSYTEGIRDSYAYVRRNGPLSSTGMARARRLVGKVIRRGKRLFQAPRVVPSDEKAGLYKRVADARRAGFDFHQRVIWADGKVLDWVLRPSYWDYRLPR
jgi:glycosyltransferase involved in cell wall biosynthesis